MDNVDFTGGKTLLELAGQLADRNVVFCVAAAERVMPELERFGVLDAIGAEHVFASLDDAAFHAAQPSQDDEQGSPEPSGTAATIRELSPVSAE